MQTNSTISILGCGWLGLPLARKLIEQGFRVKGSTTSPEKLQVLSKAGIEPYHIYLTEANVVNLVDFLKTDLLLISFPPKIRSGKGPEYLVQIQILQQAIQQSSVKYILFISSTAVYPDLNTIISETIDLSATYPENYLLQAEAEIQSTPIPVTIIRFSGLIGPDRHPGRFFSGKENIFHPQSPVNLIHLEDCISILIEIIKQDKWGQVYNACADEHPSRQEFYTAATAALNLPLPHFAPPSPANTFKIISSEKLKKDLSYRFIYPDPMLFKELQLRKEKF